MSFTRATRLLRMLTGRRALRLYLALPVLAVLLLTAGLRVHSYMLTQKIQAVLSGLERLRVDRTSEQELLKTVPYVACGDFRGYTGRGLERRCYVNISNEEVTGWLYRLAGTAPFRLLWPLRTTEAEAENLGAPFRGAYWIGWHYLGFFASVWTVDGRVSSVRYGIDVDMALGSLQSQGRFISVRSAHGFWSRSFESLRVSSTGDESPEYRVIGGDRWLNAAYRPDAPQEMIAHAFQLDLSCFLGSRRCDSVRDAAPLLWRDEQAIEARTETRLQGQANQCPDSVLAGRVRTLPDLNVYLLEVIGSRRGAGDTLKTNFRLLTEVRRGSPYGPWTDILDDRFFPWPANRAGRFPDPVAPSLKPGDRVLAFTGARFESCRMVRDTPSAEAAIRSAVPAPRRIEDDTQ